MTAPRSGAEHVDLVFEGLELAGASLEDARFDGCAFVACELSEARLRRSVFAHCRFERCGLAAADVTDAVFREVRFEGCRLSGIAWGLAANEATDPFGADFDACDLSWASFVRLDLGGRRLADCRAREARFSEVGLRGADLTGTDFAGARFLGCDLTEADLRGARDYLVDARHNVLTGARVALPEALALLHALEVELS